MSCPYFPNPMSRINWLSYPDQGFHEAKASGKLALLDFSAAPD